MRANMEIKAEEQDGKELILFQTICMHCPGCHSPTSASWMNEVGLKLRLRTATPLSDSITSTSLWQQVKPVDWDNLRAAATISTGTQMGWLWAAACQVPADLNSPNWWLLMAWTVCMKLACVSWIWILGLVFSWILCHCYPSIPN